MKNVALLVCAMGAAACRTNMLGFPGTMCPRETRLATASETDSVRSQLAMLDGVWTINWEERDPSALTLSLEDSAEVYAVEGQQPDGLECGAAFKYYTVESASLTIEADWMTLVDASSLSVFFDGTGGPFFDGFLVLDDLDGSFFDSNAESVSVEQVRLGFGSPINAGTGRTVVLDGRFTEGELSVTRGLARCEGSCFVPASSN